MTQASKRRFVSKLRRDKVLALSLLEDPATTLARYDYTVPDHVLRDLETIRDRELRYMAEKLEAKVDLAGQAADKEFVLSMVSDPAMTLRKYRLQGNPEVVTELDRLGDELLSHAVAALQGGIGPIAENFCGVGCSAAGGRQMRLRVGPRP